jgi:hypothetical protein
MKLARLLGVTLVLSLTGCQSYVNSPRAVAGRAESVKAFSDPLIARAFNAKPAIRFPARIAIAPQCDQARQQLRNLDAAGKLDALKRLPNVARIAPLSSLVMSEGDGKVSSDVLLREAAAKLHADAILILKVDEHVTDGKIFAPLTPFSLGLLPNDRAAVVCTALAALVDTRTGYVYGTLERSAGKACLTNSWDDFTRGRTIERAARDAMMKLFSEIPDFWQGVVQAHRR